jgi:hypothetical protein
LAEDVAVAKVEAEFLPGKRVLFAARGRAQVNARDTLPDGPIGYSSSELLLIALTNCTLGILTNHELLKDVPFRRCVATAECDSLQNPSRFDNFRVVIDLEVDDPALLARQPALERAAGHCPVGNTLDGGASVNVTLRMSVAGAE